MANEIIFYENLNGECSVESFLDQLPVKHRAKAIRSIELLQTFGTSLTEPHVTKILGSRYKGLYELRIQFASDISRIIYFLFDGDKFILVHGFVKKTQKTPAKELEIARNQMLEFLGRKKDEDIS
ncbi:MAG: type II toxin-antitoxin system RelE/ParE family toxin [Anaerolineae bacterium]|nr:type II toxin-antitoxin system RelE/ParE family toxin [Anaerolineae bacterium]